MKCKSCGAEVDPAVIFCPKCGKSIDAEPVAPEPPPPPVIENKTPFWFKALIAIGIIGCLVAGYMLMVNEDPTGTIDNQLNALHRNQITEAYYDYTSKEFQEITSLDVFRQFIHNYPFFSSDATFNYKNSTFKNKQGTIEGEIVTKDGTHVEVQYEVIWEHNKWKIQGIQVLKTQEGEAVSDKSEQDTLKAPVEEQLNALKNHDYKKAYQGLVSSEFEKETPYDKFEAFVNQYPILMDYHKVNYENFFIKNDRGGLTALLETNKEPITVEYKLIKENGKWKIWALRIILPHAEEKDKKTLIKMITDQLLTLKKDNTQEAYDDYASEEFKKATSYEAFENFVKKHAALRDYSKIEFHDPAVEGNTAKIKVDLQHDQGTLSLEYLLGTENGKWKIWGIQILKKPNESSEKADEKLMAPMRQLVEDQLKAIKNKDYTTAYHNFTSEDFQKVTPLEKFEEFIINQPAYSDNQSLEINKLTFDNNIGVLNGIITTKSHASYPIEYDLIQENGNWKILHIQILPPSSNSSEETKEETTSQKKPIEISKLILGNEIDLQSKVIHPATTLKHDAGDIFVNVYIEHGIQGKRLELILEHIESNSQIPPISTPLPKDEESMVSFVFSPPTHGWPKGNYRILAKVAGEKKTVEFKVE